jgi:hypothetical protein
LIILADCAQTAHKSSGERGDGALPPPDE